MNDLISRQAAIDAIEWHLRRADEIYLLTDTEKTMNHAFEIAASCVYNLPSAQPEIIRCKDCKYHDENWRSVSVRWLPCMAVRTGSNWFCGSAERRTDE